MPRSVALLAVLFGCHKGDTDDSAIETDVTVDGPVRSCGVTLETAVPDGVGSIEVAGQWGDFAPLAMAFSEDGSTARADLGELRPGTYGYKFIYDGVWETTPADVYTTWNDGFENRALFVGDCELPQLQAQSASATADGRVAATFMFTRGADGAGLESVTATVGGEPVDAAFDPHTGAITIDV